MGMLIEVIKADDVIGVLLPDGIELVVTVLSVSNRGLYVTKIRKVEVNDAGITMTPLLISCKHMATLSPERVVMYWKVDERALSIYDGS